MKTFKVWIPDWLGDEPEEIQAYDHEEAARLLVEQHDDEGRTLDHPILACVTESDCSDLKTFEVYSEAVITYRAKEIK